jgi:hypothetical protein
LSCHSRSPAPPTVNKHFTATRTSAFSSATFSSSSWSSSSDDRYNIMLYEKRIRIRKKGKTTTTSIQQAQAQVPSHQPQRYYQQLIRRSFVHQSDTSENNNNNSEDHQDSVVDVDFFKLFDIPRKFGTSLPLLKNQYLKLMIEYHPDKQQHQQHQDSNNDSASITAETITNAYQILQLPHTRANHLLELYNCPLMEYDNTNNNNDSDNNNNSDNNSDNNNNDMSQFVGMDFLMDMMEYRERIEDLVDASSNNKQDEFRTISKETKVLQNQCEESLKDLLDNNNNDDNDNNNNNNNIVLLLDDDNKLQEARKLTAQLQYWYRLECTLKEEMDI